MARTSQPRGVLADQRLLLATPADHGSLGDADPPCRSTFSKLSGGRGLHDVKQIVTIGTTDALRILRNVRRATDRRPAAADRHRTQKPEGARSGDAGSYAMLGFFSFFFFFLTLKGRERTGFLRRRSS